MRFLLGSLFHLTPSKWRSFITLERIHFLFVHFMRTKCFNEITAIKWMANERLFSVCVYVYVCVWPNHNFYYCIRMSYVNCKNRIYTTSCWNWRKFTCLIIKWEYSLTFVIETLFTEVLMLSVVGTTTTTRYKKEEEEDVVVLDDVIANV